MKNVVLTRKPLGNKRFQWKQKEYILSTFNCVAQDMDLMIRNCKEAGFNLLEVGWSRHDKVWEAVENCEKYGVDLLFQDLSLFGGMMHFQDDRPVEDETIRETVKILKDKKHIVGYYVWDEPYDEKLFAEARRQSDILLECAPDALLYSVFPPSYNPGPTWDNGQYYEAFERYIQKLNPPVVSFDCYPVGDYDGHYPGLKYTDDKQLDNSPMWLDLAVARNFARKYERPFWFYYQGCPVFNTEKFTFPMVRALMHAGAMYGAKGLQNYTITGLCNVPQEGGDYPTETTALLITGEKGEFFEDQKQIHEEFHQLGNTLMALTNEAVYHSSDVAPFGKYGEIYSSFEEHMEDSEILCGNLPDRTSVGEFKDDYGNPYLFVLNRDFYRPLNAVISLQANYHQYEVSKKDGLQSLVTTSDKISLSLDCGDAILLRLQPASEDPYTITYALE